MRGKIAFACFVVLLIGQICRAEIPGKISGQLRSYYFNRNFTTPRLVESLAIGGYVKYETPSWNNLNLALAAYTSQPLFIADPAHGGSNILTPSQNGYSSLGQASLNADLGGYQLTLYRQALNTPFININDVRMTPYLVEAYTLTGQPSSQFYWMASYVASLKTWVDEQFRPMTQVAGLTGTDQGVALVGLVATPSNRLTVQAWNYYCLEFMNMFYCQTDAVFSVSKDIGLACSFQSALQQSIGQALGGNFTTGMIGLQGLVAFKDTSFYLAITDTGTGRNMYNPWGAYFGFNNNIEEENSLAGEQAWTVGLNNDFGIVGIAQLKTSAELCYSFISGRGSLLAPDQREGDFTVDYIFSDKFTLRGRGAVVSHALDSATGASQTNIRLIANYNF